ncbi:MAG: hypothetical protein WD512_11490 [Candidatus Paceibacterota bacterium]
MAVCFRGKDDYFQKSWDTISKYIIEDLKTKYQVDVFLNKYQSPMDAEIIEKMNPVAILQHNNDRYKYPGELFINSLQMTELLNMIMVHENQNKFKYDYIIITRFDLTFNQELSKCDVNYDKINMECMFVPDMNSGDNFFLFKRDLLDIFKKSIDNCLYDRKTSHQLFRYFEAYDNDICHYIGGQTSKRHPIYDVMFRFTRNIQ